MNLKLKAVVAPVILLLGIGGFVVMQSAKKAVNATPINAEHSVLAKQDSVESLMQGIADLEVEKTLQSVRFTSENPTMIRLNREQAALQKRLQELKPNTNYQPQLAQVTIKALEIKRVKIEAQYNRDKARFTDDNYLQAHRQSQLRLLSERLKQLQKL
jgi:hypothetical protein